MSTKRDISIRQSTTYLLPMLMERPGVENPDDPVDADVWNAKMQIRSQEGVGTELLHEASVENGQITIGGTNAQVTIQVRIPYAATTLFTWKNGYYDLIVIDDEDTARLLLEGKVSINSSCTSLAVAP